MHKRMYSKVKEMGEDDVGEGGKVGMSRKLIAGIIVAVVVAAGIGVVLWQLKDGDNSTTFSVDLYWDYVDYADALHLTVIDIQGPERLIDTLSMYGIEIQVFNLTTNLRIENIYTSQIINGSKVHGMQWIDQDSDSILEIGDYLRINKTYGVNGNIDMNDHFIGLGPVDGLFNHYPERIYTPPAEFLDMDVVKTSAGWNMTVTWVNETIPDGFIEGGHIGFRIENESEAFYGIQKFGWAVPLDSIESNFVAEPGTYNGHNMTYYYIDWFDNNMDKKLTVNDTIVITEFSESEETLNFKLSNSQYGWEHVIFEVTLP